MKWGCNCDSCYVFVAPADEPLMNEETIAHVTSLVHTHGTDCWWTLPVGECEKSSVKCEESV